MSPEAVEFRDGDISQYPSLAGQSQVSFGIVRGKRAPRAISPISRGNVSFNMDGTGTAATDPPAVDDGGSGIMDGDTVVQEYGSQVGSAIAGKGLTVSCNSGHWVRRKRT